MVLRFITEGFGFSRSLVVFGTEGKGLVKVNLKFYRTRKTW